MLKQRQTIGQPDQACAAACTVTGQHTLLVKVTKKIRVCNMLEAAAGTTGCSQGSGVVSEYVAA